MITITVTGIAAALIERANNASFYGIKKLFGDLSETAPGRIAAEDACKAYLESNGIDWNGLEIIRARTIDTSGTPIPYKAEIDFIYD